MDFIFPMPDTVKKSFKEKNIENVDLYISSKLDANLEYNSTYYVIFDSKLHVFDKNFTLLHVFTKEDMDTIKIEYFLNYGKIYVVKDNHYQSIGYFDKSQLKYFALFEKYCLKVMNHQMSEEDYQSKDVLQSHESICPKCGRPYEANIHYCKKCYGKSSTFLRLLKYIKKYKIAFFSILVLLILSSVLGVIIPIFTSKILYNEVLTVGGKWYGKILLFTSLFLLLRVFGSILSILYGRIAAKTSSNICFDMKNDVFSSMQRLSLKFFKDKETGNLMNRVVWDVNMVFYFITDDIPNFCINLLQTLGIVVYLLCLNAKLALFVFIPIPFIVLAFIKISPVFHRNWQQNSARENELSNIVSDTLEGFRVVKVFSGHSKEIHRFEEVSKRNTNSFVHHMKFRSTVYPIIQLIISFSIFIVWGFGGYLVIKGENSGGMNYGDFATFVAGLDLLYTPLEYMTNILFSNIPRVLSCSRRIFEIVDADVDVKEHENPVTLKNIQGEIEFQNVSFSYEINKTILKNISFKVPANTSIGIVGQTGAGKSTLMNLLARLYDVNEGNILIDGINIKDLSFQTLHSNVTMISQDTYLFKGTILENIRYAKPEASLEEVIQAAKIANAHDFIMKFENGYDTLIGQGATNLSGGERQRISIARAVLVNARIIIFDEATSAMDTITERAIQESITKLSENRTVLMIAHRLSTLKDVDRLIVIDKQTIIEEGTMQELIDLNGKFAELYNIQQDALKHIRIGD